MLESVREWVLGVWTWFKMLLPAARGKLLERAYRQGVMFGINSTCKQLANLNRKQRRKAVREIVKEYKDDDKKPIVTS